MLIQETYVNRTENYLCSEPDPPYEPWTDAIGPLFLSLQREHGRCIGKTWIDTDDGPQQIGWCFEKRVKYTDCNDSFLLETWVTVFNSFEKKVVIEADYYQFT